MEWVRTWLVISRRDDATSKVEQPAHTAAEVRQLLTAARADPAVWHTRVESRRELAGDKPTHCVCGEAYRTAGSWPTPHDWLDCGCGGHFWWRCRECGLERVEPPAAYDCRPHWPGQRMS
ncbi:hypothetical protein [Phytohabitans houttuyneae]|uniref:Uncharacterized protein n=1 Tax=Phytohabitans houttuyneae TaxID=1076126 RepID=A0A6V8KBV7_9ACTN|nr:hypothetical protein [Phytohabitans houttuyneae]GFJ79466.1 hypothetical protein Phou_036460 [Phytohabitans houttuyneae]